MPNEADALKPFQPGELSWRHRITDAAHLFKARVEQHHKELIPVLRPFVSPDAVVFDIGAHAGQCAKLFARLAPRDRIYAFEPGSYARNFLRPAMRFNRLANVTIVPEGLSDGAYRREGRAYLESLKAGSSDTAVIPFAAVDGAIEELPIEARNVGIEARHPSGCSKP